MSSSSSSSSARGDPLVAIREPLVFFDHTSVRPAVIDRVVFERLSSKTLKKLAAYSLVETVLILPREGEDLAKLNLAIIQAYIDYCSEWSEPLPATFPQFGTALKANSLLSAADK